MADGSPMLPPELSADLKKMTEEAKNALAALAEVKADNVETKKNLEKWFADYETHNATHAKNYAKYEKSLADAEDARKKSEEALSKMSAEQLEAVKRLGQLELTIATGGGKKSDESAVRETPEYKGFFAMLKKNEHPAGSRDLFAFRPDFKSDEYKTLRTDSDVQGGYLIPQVMDSEIRKNITEMSPVRLFAKNRVAMSKTMEIPRRLSIPVATFEGEGEQAGSDQATYGSEQVTLYRQTVKVPATLDMMVSSAFDLEREIAADVGEGYGLGEGRNFVKGVGVKGPQGFIMDTRVEVVNTASSGEIAWDDMINIASKLKRGQNPWFFFNRRTLGKLQQLKSTFGVPIWQPVSGDKPATIWGFPYNSDFIDLDDAQNGSNAKSVVFGDLRRGYEIYDMLGISVVRDDLTKADQAITQWIFRRYLTGRVIMPEALKVLKIA